MDYFFLVADWGAYNYLDTPNIMLSAGSIWSPRKKWMLSRTRLPDQVKRVIIDSGGFSLFSRYGEYPFSLTEYLDLIHYIQEKYPVFRVSTLDYPCEPSVNRKQQPTNIQRIEHTVDNAILCFEAEKKIPWLPVIQGHSITEYLRCVDLYEDTGIKSDYWAIGSICTRKGRPYEIRSIITTIKGLHEKHKLHAFGLGLTYIEDPEVFHAIYSSDSAAWNWGISGFHMRDRKRYAAQKYMSRIHRLQEGFGFQETLE